MIRKKGFIAILTVLVLLMFSLSFTIAATYLSIGESQTALALFQGEAALQAAEGCAEDALLLSSRNEEYSGGTHSYLGATCDVVVAKEATVWTLDVVSAKNGFSRSLEIIFDRQPGPPVVMTLQSWLEK